jgi:hypothetical protein
MLSFHNYTNFSWASGVFLIKTIMPRYMVELQHHFSLFLAYIIPYIIVTLSHLVAFLLLSYVSKIAVFFFAVSCDITFTFLYTKYKRRYCNCEIYHSHNFKQTSFYVPVLKIFLHCTIFPGTDPIFGWLDLLVAFCICTSYGHI